MARLISVFGAIVATSAIGMAEPARRGTYVFDSSVSTVVTVNGETLPSCGDEAISTLNDYVPATAVHTPGRDVVLVNGERWKSTESNGNSFAMRPLKEGSDLNLTLLFRSRGRAAVGFMIAARRDADHKTTCIDHRNLSGTYRR